MCASAFQFLRQFHIIFQVIFFSGFIQNISGITDTSLRDFPLSENLIKSHFHTLYPVQGVKDTEHIDAGLCRLLDEFADDIIWIILIPDSIRTAKQHLKQHIGYLLSQSRKPLPGRLTQKTVGYIEGRSAPHFQGKQISPIISHRRSDFLHINGTHPRSHQRLMCIPHGCIRD